VARPLPVQFEADLQKMVRFYNSNPIELDPTTAADAVRRLMAMVRNLKIVVLGLLDERTMGCRIKRLRIPVVK